jgi:hypothetical protein
MKSLKDTNNMMYMKALCFKMIGNFEEADAVYK